MSDSDDISLSSVSDVETVLPRRTSSARDRAEQERSQRAISPVPPVSSKASSDALLSSANPFLQSLPSKPHKLTKERDLPGAVKVPSGGKRKEAIDKLIKANSRITNAESLVRHLHGLATETHTQAVGAIKSGTAALKDLRREIKAVTTDRNRLQKKNDALSSKVTEFANDKKLEEKLKKLSEKETKNLENRVKELKIDLGKKDKELAELRKKVEAGGSSEDKARALHRDKVRMNVEAHIHKKQFDKKEKEKIERKKRAEKNARVDSLAGGGALGTFNLGDGSDSSSVSTFVDARATCLIFSHVHLVRRSQTRTLPPQTKEPSVPLPFQVSEGSLSKKQEQTAPRFAQLKQLWQQLRQQLRQ